MLLSLRGGGHGEQGDGVERVERVERMERMATARVATTILSNESACEGVI